MKLTGLPAENHTFIAGMDLVAGPPYYPRKPMRKWDLTRHPMWLNFSQPTLLNLNTDWEKKKYLAVVTTDSTYESWIELLIEGGRPEKAPPGSFVPAAHPIHLHGHDFALLDQSSSGYDPVEAAKRIKRDNPPRRDVALLPSNGYLIIAFKADNPGVWLTHCHIAWHASSGLALQILENKDEIHFGHQTLRSMRKTCQKWAQWYKRQQAKLHEPLQEDSGI